MLSSRGVSGTVIDPKIVFQSALLANCSSLILFHNHPSQNLNPSEADKQITQKIAKSGQFLDITLLDHIIITESSYFSFADKGIL